MKLLLTSSGLRQPHAQKAFLSVLGQDRGDCAVAIITTASEEWREGNKNAVATKALFDNARFGRIEYVDIENQDPRRLGDFDRVYINGGNPFYLLHHPAHSGADRVLADLVEQGTPVAGSSAGAMVLGPDLTSAAWFTPQMNTRKMTDLRAQA